MAALTPVAPVSPEHARCKELSNTQRMRVRGVAIASAETHDFGVAIIDAAWKGDAGAGNEALLGFSGSVVTVTDTAGGGVTGWIYVWVAERKG